MKILIITHSGNLTYGAAKSMQYFLKNTQYEFDIVFNKAILKTYTMEEIRGYVGKKCGSIFFYDLPLEYHVMSDFRLFRKESTIIQNVNYVLRLIGRRVKYLLNKRRLDAFIKNYSLLYLNSVILYPLITRELSTVIHVRELLKQREPKYFEKKISQCKKVICIDDAVEKHLKSTVQIDENKIARLRNPFDMASVSRINTSDVAAKYDLDCKKVMFLIAGVLAPEKGVGFVCDAFSTLKDKNLCLLVAGNKDSSYAQKLVEKYSGENIKFLGEIKNMNELYAISDCIVRGENEYCTGRTVYEGMYSGCMSLIPGYTVEQVRADFSQEEEKYICLYRPRDTDDFIGQCLKINKKSTNDYPTNNIEKYIDKFEQLLNLARN